MAHDLTSTQARTASTTDQVIYNEIDTITRAVIVAALAGELTTEVADGTTMTECTPIITVTSVGAGAFIATETIIIAGETITLGDGATDGTGIDQAIADINNTAITGLVASRLGNEIVLTYIAPLSAWNLVLVEGSGTALANLGFTAGTTAATTPTSVDYYSMWSGLTADRKKLYEYTQVIHHFQGLGYSIITKQNTDSAQVTFKWEIYW
jgi:hypothetical protein